MALVSIVIPVYNEEECLENLFEQLQTLAGSVEEDFEFILVDDGSSDNSLAVIEKKARENPAFKLVVLSRNFGQQSATTAGLDHATGDAVVTMDADLQDPPELVARMIARWREGYDVVYTRRVNRLGESVFKRASAAAFYRVWSKLAKVEIPTDTGDFRLLSRKAVDAMHRLRERNRLMRGLTAWVGFRQTFVEFERPARTHGTTKYGIARLVRLAADGIVSFSWLPLRLALYAGLVAGAICTTFLVVCCLLWMFTDWTPSGLLAVAALVVLLGSLQLLTVGIMGEYVGRILEEVKARPIYFVRETVNLDDKPREG